MYGFANEKEKSWSESKFKKDLTVNQSKYSRAIIKLVLGSDTSDLFIDD